MVPYTPPSQDASTKQIWDSYLKKYRKFVPDMMIQTDILMKRFLFEIFYVKKGVSKAKSTVPNKYCSNLGINLILTLLDPLICMRFIP